jgi:hypothetical protein
MTPELTRAKVFSFIHWSSQMEVTLLSRQSSGSLDWLTSISIEVKQWQSIVEQVLAVQEL